MAINHHQGPSVTRSMPDSWQARWSLRVGVLREIRLEFRSRDASRISPLMKRQPEEDVLAHLMREAIRGHHQRSSEVIIRGHQRSSSEVIINGHHQRSSSEVIIRGCTCAPTRAMVE